MSELTAHRERTILVTGATGRQGGAVARHLRERGYTVRAFTRDPGRARGLLGEGVEAVRGDFDDFDSIRRALEGAYGVFSVQNPAQADSDGERRQGIAMIDAAARQRVTHFIYASSIAADAPTGISFLESKRSVEEHLRQSGLMYTVLRPAPFMENFLNVGPPVNGVLIALPLAPGMVLQQIAVDDIGRIAAYAFEHPAAFRNRSLDIAGDENSLLEITAAISRALNREAGYYELSWEDYERAAGPDITNFFRLLQDQWLSGRGRIDIPALKAEVPELTPFERWVHAQNWERYRTAG